MSGLVGEVLVCLDSFKGSIDSLTASTCVAEALRQAAPATDAVAVGFADGGEGTVDALVASGWTPEQHMATRADGSLGTARIAVRGATAVIELAQVAGLPDSPITPASALRGTTRGVGELVLRALDAGRTDVVLALGGSSTSDGGAGMLAALGARFTAGHGEIEPRGAQGLLDVTAVHLDSLDPRLAGATVTCATDVDNPLLGPRGAAATFAPQKGADPRGVELIETALGHFAQLAGGLELAAVPGSGAAGGTAFAAVAALGASVVSGADFVARANGLHARIPAAGAVIVGEGRLDAQTLDGKGPAYVSHLAAEAGIPAYAIAGHVALGPDDLLGVGIRFAISLSALAPSVHEAIRHPQTHLRTAARELARLITAPPGDGLSA